MSHQRSKEKKTFKVGDRLHDRSKYLTERQKKQYGYLPDDTDCPPNLYQNTILRLKRKSCIFKVINGGKQ